VLPVLVDDKGNELEGEAEGMLCIKQAWPSCLRTVYGDHERWGGGGGVMGGKLSTCGFLRLGFKPSQPNPSPPCHPQL
jgi:hypothetical protein